VLTRVQALDCRTVPVLHHGVLVGLLTMDNVGEFLMIHAAEKKNRLISDSEAGAWPPPRGGYGAGGSVKARPRR